MVNIAKHYQLTYEISNLAISFSALVPQGKSGGFAARAIASYLSSNES